MSNAKSDARHQPVLQSVLMISTGHLTARTAQFLRDHDAADWPSPGGHFGDMGWFFWVDEGARSSLPHLPYDLMSAFEYAAGVDAAFIVFQDVSPVLPHLPTYRKSGGFVADPFLNRAKKTIDELDDDAAAAAQRTLSLNPEFKTDQEYLAARMTAIIDDITVHASTGQLSALPHDCLVQLSDLAITYHFHARSKAKGLEVGSVLIEDLAEQVDIILADRELAGLARHRRTREILESVQYRFRLTIQLLQAEPTRP